MQVPGVAVAVLALRTWRSCMQKTQSRDASAQQQHPARTDTCSIDICIISVSLIAGSDSLLLLEDLGLACLCSPRDLAPAGCHVTHGCMLKMYLAEGHSRMQLLQWQARCTCIQIQVGVFKELL